MKKSDLLFVLLVGLVYFVILSGLVKTASVEGVSMYPIFQNGYLVFYQSPTNVHVGDVVIYVSHSGYVIHEVVETHGQFYITKGVDPYTNQETDNVIGLEPAYGLSTGQIVGKAVKVDGQFIAIPYLGYLSIIFNSL